MGAPTQGVLCILALLAVTLPCNVVQVLAWLLLPRRLGRLVSNRCYAPATYTILFFCEYNSKLKLVFYGDELETESALIISNHLGAEFVHLFQLAYRYKMLMHLRFVQKDALKWLPVNWTCYFHEHPFIKRGEGEAARTASTKKMRETLCSYGLGRIPVQMVLFPEGTWVGGKKEKFILDRSQAFAKKQGLPVFKNVLAPRAAGFRALVDGAAAAMAEGGDSVKALYDLTFAYDQPVHPVRLGEQMPPSVLHYLDGAKQHAVPRCLHIYINRFAFPRGARGKEDETHPVLSDPAGFVQRSFVEKEAMLEAFKHTGKFPGKPRPDVPPPPARLLLGCAGAFLIVVGSWFLLWLISPALLIGYLVLLAVLYICSVGTVSWDEGGGTLVAAEEAAEAAAAAEAAKKIR